MKGLTLERLREVLSYDESSGEFTRKIATARRSKVGEIAGSINAEGYRYIRIDGGNYKANRLAVFYVSGEWPSGQVDHINGKKADDRIENLRVCSPAENSQNRASPKGAYKASKGNRFVSFVTTNGKRSYLGKFATEEEARAAYSSAKLDMHPFQCPENLPK